MQTGKHGCLKTRNLVHAQARDALAVGAGATVLGYLKGEAGTWDAIVRAYHSKGARRSRVECIWLFAAECSEGTYCSVSFVIAISCLCCSINA